uniref:Ig-like domain-containing protein n=1 Tax=Biomphalaria glabrata TaxID=6526 RepID=A0A2C9KAG8_BIOGL
MKSIKQQSASEGEKGKLECLARSIPKPISVIWTKDGREINYALSGRFSVEKKDLGQHVQSILHIQVVESGDFGLYNCTIENDKGVSSEQVELIEKHVLPITYIIIGIIGGLAFIFVTALVCVLYRRCKKEDQASPPPPAATGSYTDTDSSSDKKREKADSPNTLMGQLRQEYRFSADYDDMPYKDQQTKGNNNGYGFIEPCETYSDTQIYDGDYVRRGEDLIPDRLDPLYNTGTGYSMSSFRGNYYDTTPPPTMTRLTPLHMSNTKLATDV